MARRVHNQPPRDDYVVYPELGLATHRTDHLDGSATFAVQVAAHGCEGLHLTTGLTITRTGAVFTLNDPDRSCEHPDLASALAAVADHLPRMSTASAA